MNDEEFVLSVYPFAVLEEIKGLTRPCFRVALGDINGWRGSYRCRRATTPARAWRKARYTVNGRLIKLLEK